MNQFYPKLSDEDERLATNIVDCAFQVHNNLGPGLLERIYEVCFCHELEKRNIKFESQIPVPISYEGIRFDEGFRVDVLVENKIICELKSVIEKNKIFEAQLMTYLKLTKLRLGFLINFNVPLIKDGIKRIIL